MDSANPAPVEETVLEVPGVAAGAGSAGGGVPRRGRGGRGAGRTWAEGEARGAEPGGARRAPMGSGWKRAPAPEPQSRPCCLAKARTARGGERGEERRRHSRRQGMRDGPWVPSRCSRRARARLWPQWRPWWRRTAPCAAAPAREPEREQLPVAPRPRLRGPAGAAERALTLRRKRSAAGGRVSGWAARPEWAWRSARGACAHLRGGRGRHLEVGGGAGSGALVPDQGRRGPRESGVVGCLAERRLPLP